MHAYVNKTIIVIVIIAVITFAGVPQASYADMGPKGDQWEVIQAVGAVTLITAISVGVYKWFKHKEHAPLSAVLFNEEEVYITLEKDVMAVEAVFEYQNTTEQRLRMDLYFPFIRSVKNTISDLKILLEAGDAAGGRLLDHTAEENRVLVDFIIEPKQRVSVKVRYHEAIKDNHAEYIITSIRKWQRPVGKALFIVKLPASFKAPLFSFADNLVEKSGVEGSPYVVYTFRMRDLYPDKEFQIAWQ